MISFRETVQNTPTTQKQARVGETECHKKDKFSEKRCDKLKLYELVNVSVETLTVNEQATVEK